MGGRAAPNLGPEQQVILASAHLAASRQMEAHSDPIAAPSPILHLLSPASLRPGLYSVLRERLLLCPALPRPGCPLQGAACARLLGGASRMGPDSGQDPAMKAGSREARKVGLALARLARTGASASHRLLQYQAEHSHWSQNVWNCAVQAACIFLEINSLLSVVSFAVIFPILGVVFSPVYCLSSR